MANTVLIPANEIAAMIGNPNHDIFIRETMSMEVEIDFPDHTFDNNYVDDGNVSTYGWRTWENPTQSDLDNDLKTPDNLWEPVYGEYVPVQNLTLEYLDKIKKYQSAKWTLNSGTVVEKFNPVWSDYKQLTDIVMERIYDGKANTTTFTIGTEEKVLSKDRIFVYVDGILQPSTNFTVAKLVVSITATINVGAKLVVIYKKYQPTAAELSFDPDTSDDILVNTQYKYGYDYTSYKIRDTNDRLSDSVYYFWVKNKNTPPAGRGMSVLQAKNLLAYGPSLYMVFQNITEANDQKKLPVRYDAITVYGLNKYVSRDDTYKLRFTRNFTLRDDPNEIDFKTGRPSRGSSSSLKNVHTEWTLLRPAQNKRIPLNLWNKLVESALGQDSIGNTLPYTYLKDYDHQHGTSNSFGLGVGQILAEQAQVIASIKHTILNTTLTINLGGTKVPDYIQNLKLSQLDKYFDTPENIRKTLDLIWREAKPKQINEIFFAVINDALANNFEFKDVFKTSRLSVYSIKTVGQILTGTNDE